jgi:hypothetical protein
VRYASLPLVGALVAIALIHQYLLQIVLVLGVAAGVTLVVVYGMILADHARKWHEYRQRQLDGIRARADEQHGLLMAGNERGGVYGEYPPAAI